MVGEVHKHVEEDHGPRRQPGRCFVVRTASTMTVLALAGLFDLITFDALLPVNVLAFDALFFKLFFQKKTVLQTYDST